MPRSHRTLDFFTNLRKSPLVRTLFVALGFTTIFLIWLIKPGVEPSQHALYHWSGSAKDFFLPIALDMVISWLVLTLLLLAARAPGRMRVAIWAGLLFFTPWVVLENLHILALTPTTHQWNRILFLGALIATLLLTALWRPARTQRFENIVASASTLLIFAGIFGAFLFCRLAWYGWQASRLPEKFPLHHAQTIATIQPHRIIWIVFDELSYQQVYEQRFPGLQLPAFDALAADAAVFTQAVPIGISTEIVLPGLLAGKPFDNMRTSPTGELSVHNEATGKWQTFDQHDTVFQDALNAGYRTAVAGWYNPYCHIVSSVLDNCLWTHSFGIENNMEPSGTLLSNSLAPAYALASMFIDLGSHRMKFFCMDLLHIPTVSVEGTRLHILDYKTLYAASDRLIRDRSAGFVLLHLPIPHPGGIYDRKTGKFATSGASYIDNLALTDKCLAALRATLEQTGQWDSSTIVIMGDHSWRTKQIWKFEKINSSWTRENVSASHNWQYDPRPAYIVKLPGQTTGTRIDTPYRAVNTRKLFDAIMAHQINTPTDLSTWVHSLPAPH